MASPHVKVLLLQSEPLAGRWRPLPQALADHLPPRRRGLRELPLQRRKVAALGVAPTPTPGVAPGPGPGSSPAGVTAAGCIFAIFVFIVSVAPTTAATAVPV